MTEYEWFNCSDPLLMLDFVTEGSRRRLDRTTEISISNRRLWLMAAAMWRSSWDPLVKEPQAAWSDANQAELLAEGLQPTGAVSYFIQRDAEQTVRETIDNRAGLNLQFVDVVVDLIENPCRRFFPWSVNRLNLPATTVRYRKGSLDEIVRRETHNTWETHSSWELHQKWRKLCNHPTIDGLARAAYFDRNVETFCLDNSLLAVLADALEEFDCPSVVTCNKCDGRGYQHNQMCVCQPTTIVAGQMFGSGKMTHPVLEHLRSPIRHYRGCWALDLVLGRE
jgi:hypothetical protein